MSSVPFPLAHAGATLLFPLQILWQVPGDRIPYYARYGVNQRRKYEIIIKKLKSWCLSHRDTAVLNGRTQTSDPTW